jgi:hypothetical protein
MGICIICKGLYICYLRYKLTILFVFRHCDNAILVEPNSNINEILFSFSHKTRIAPSLYRCNKKWGSGASFTSNYIVLASQSTKIYFIFLPPHLLNWRARRRCVLQGFHKINRRRYNTYTGAPCTCT